MAASGEVDHRPGHQCRQAPHEFHRTQDHMRSSIVVGRLEGDDNVAVTSQGQTSFCNSMPSDISAEALKLLALMRFTGDTGMQRKSCLSTHQITRFLQEP